jgi:DNA repair exonuclease SbcCD ATPase subunit
VFTIPFHYSSPKDIQVLIDSVPIDFEFNTPNSVKLSSAPSGGSLVEIRRSTGIKDKAVTFTLGANFNTKALNASADQAIMKLQEHEDQLGNCLKVNASNICALKGSRLRGLGTPENPTDATPKEWVESLVQQNLQAQKDLVQESQSKLDEGRDLLKAIQTEAGQAESTAMVMVANVSEQVGRVQELQQAMLSKGLETISQSNQSLGHVKSLTEKAEQLQDQFQVQVTQSKLEATEQHQQAITKLTELNTEAVDHHNTAQDLLNQMKAQAEEIGKENQQALKELQEKGNAIISEAGELTGQHREIIKSSQELHESFKAEVEKALAQIKGGKP